MSLPARFCEICGIIHDPPIHDFRTCWPRKLYFSAPFDPHHWPTTEEMTAMKEYWEAVLSDKGTKPLS